MKLTRVDKRAARAAFNEGRHVAFDLNQPTVKLGETVDWKYVTTCTKGEESFDEVVADCMAWQHRYPGSRGLSYYVWEVS